MAKKRKKSSKKSHRSASTGQRTSPRASSRRASSKSRSKKKVTRKTSVSSAKRAARKKVSAKTRPSPSKSTTRAATRRRPARNKARDDYRLDSTAVPLSYSVEVQVDPATDTGFSGTVRIDLELSQLTHELRLNMADLEIEHAQLEYGFEPSPNRSAMPETTDPTEPAPPHPAILEVGPSSGHSTRSPTARAASRSKSFAEETESELEVTAPPSWIPSSAWPLEAPAPVLDSDWRRHVLEPEEANTDTPQGPPSTPQIPSPDDERAQLVQQFLLATPHSAPTGSGAYDAPSTSVPVKVEIEAATETVLLRFGIAVPAGTATLHLRFKGRLRTDLCGLYFAQSGERRYAFTQLEASNARRFFPCFDEPRFKAPLQLSVTTDQDNETLSNSPVEEIRYDDRGRKTVSFAPTPPLPTYLYALAVGPLESSVSRRVGDTEIQIWHVPGKAHLASFAAEVAAESLRRLESYFEIAYPYEKLDLVAVPDFEIGAMENAGAVFFRETLMLVDPATATTDEKKRAAEVIAHELAHMWFGDLVTMFWWDDLWLKESFATWMAYSVIDEWKPEWKMWHRFQNDRLDAYDLDSLKNTRPVYAPVSNPAQASEQYDAITYEKGASVVRMIEQYLGAETFQSGVRLYMQRHAGGNASAADLWSALSEASGQDVGRVVRPWIEQEGYPLLRIQRKRAAGAYEIRQERFLEGSSKRSNKGAGAAARWSVPWVGRWVGADFQGEHRELLTRARQVVEAPAEAAADSSVALYGNAQEGGFFRVLHSRDEILRLLDRRKELHSVERLGFVSHVWASVRAGLAPLEDFLDLVSALSDEDDPDVLHQLDLPLTFLAEVADAAGKTTAARFREFLVETFAGALLQSGLAPRPGESDEARRHRARIHGILGEIADWSPLVRSAERAFDEYLEDPAGLDAELADPVVFVAAAHADLPRYERLVASMRSAPTPQAQQRFLLALGRCRDKALTQRTLELCLTEAIATQDVARVLAQLLRNPHSREISWRFLTRQWKKLSVRLPSALVRRMIEAAQYRATPTAKSEFRRFFRAHPVPSAARTLRQVEERIDIRRAQMRRNRVELERWLRRRSGK